MWVQTGTESCGVHPADARAPQWWPPTQQYAHGTLSDVRWAGRLTLLRVILGQRSSTDQRTQPDCGSLSRTPVLILRGWFRTRVALTGPKATHDIRVQLVNHRDGQRSYLVLDVASGLVHN